MCVSIRYDCCNGLLCHKIRWYLKVKSNLKNNTEVDAQQRLIDDTTDSPVALWNAATDKRIMTDFIVGTAMCFSLLFLHKTSIFIKLHYVVSPSFRCMTIFCFNPKTAHPA